MVCSVWLPLSSSRNRMHDNVALRAESVEPIALFAVKAVHTRIFFALA